MDLGILLNRRYTKLFFALPELDTLIVSLIRSAAIVSLPRTGEAMGGGLASMNFLFSRTLVEEVILVSGIGRLSKSSITPFTSTAKTEVSVRNF